MPKTLGELGAWWEGVDANFVGSYKPNAGRLLVFAPNVEPWMELAAWNRYWHTPIDSVFGVEEEFGETLADLLFGV